MILCRGARRDDGRVFRSRVLFPLLGIAFPLSVVETDRLVLRRLTPEDAAFMRRLVNEPSWLEFIGDRGVRTEEDAREYLRNGAIAS